MNQFKNFNINPALKSFVGDKIPMKRLFDEPITVLDYKVSPSTKKENTNCLTLQILKKDEKRVVFTGSSVLIDQIERVPKEGFPFETVIKNENEYFEFT